MGRIKVGLFANPVMGLTASGNTSGPVPVSRNLAVGIVLMRQ